VLDLREVDHLAKRTDGVIKIIESHVRLLIEAEVSFFKRNEPAAADDQVVEQGDIQKLACLNHGAGNGHIIRRRSGILRGMIMADQDCRSHALDGGLEHLRNAHLR